MFKIPNKCSLQMKLNYWKIQRQMALCQKSQCRCDSMIEAINPSTVMTRLLLPRQFSSPHVQKTRAEFCWTHAGSLSRWETLQLWSRGRGCAPSPVLYLVENVSHVHPALYVIWLSISCAEARDARRRLTAWRLRAATPRWMPSTPLLPPSFGCCLWTVPRRGLVAIHETFLVASLEIDGELLRGRWWAFECIKAAFIYLFVFLQMWKSNRMFFKKWYV